MATRELERVQRADRAMAGLAVEREEDGRGAQHEPDHQPLDGLVGRDRRRQLALPEHAAPEVGEDVREPDADQHRDQQRLAPVGGGRDVAQRHQERQPVADPADAQQRHRSAARWPPGARRPPRSARTRAAASPSAPARLHTRPPWWVATMIPVHTGEPRDRERPQRAGDAPYSCIAITPPRRRPAPPSASRRPPRARIATTASGTAIRTRPTRPLTACRTAAGASRRPTAPPPAAPRRSRASVGS